MSDKPKKTDKPEKATRTVDKREVVKIVRQVRKYARPKDKGDS